MLVRRLDEEAQTHRFRNLIKKKKGESCYFDSNTLHFPFFLGGNALEYLKRILIVI